MIFRTLKDLAIIALLASGLTGCTQLFGSSDGNAPGSDAASQAASGRVHHRYVSSHSRLFPAEGLDDPTPDSSFFGMGGGDFWEHLRHDFKLNSETEQPQVQAQINWFLHNKAYLDRTLRRAQPYMYYILQEVEKRDLPAELVLLPVQESAFNPTAISGAGAVGMWQLMRATARDLGVKQDFWFDGRRDIYASTNAALDQLMYLQSYFGGDWLLAIAAYNCGEGTVQNAIRRNTMHGKATDFWDLPLPQATRSYVPELLALAEIIRDPGKYGITLPPVSDKPYLAQVDIGAPISLARAAQLAGLSLDQVKQLNPGYNRMMTDPNGPYKLILPIDRIALFKEEVSSLPSLPKTTWGRYRVQRGDTLAKIAAHYHTSVSELIEANHLRVRRAPVGQVIMIPTGTEQVTPHVDNSSDSSSSTDQTAAAATSNSADSAVSEANQLAPATSSDSSSDQSSDASSAVSNDNSPTMASTSDDTDADTDMSTTVSKKQIHIVKHNETLNGIAKHYHVSTNDLMHWNKLHSSHVKPGEKLIVAMGTTSNRSSTRSNVSTQKIAAHTKTNSHVVAQNSIKTSAKTTIRPDHYIVKSGDTVSGIAKKLGVKSTHLMAWNNLTSNSSLKPGERLVVH